MKKYYTRACNFFSGKHSRYLVKKNLSLPLCGNPSISFDSIEIITRKKSKKIRINQIKSLPKNLKLKVLSDLKSITKRKSFKGLKLSKSPILMGILNLTPDSFSDGGMYNDYKKSIKQIKHLLKSNTKILDIGGESTRPGSKSIDPKLEWNRIKKVLIKTKNLNIFISIDTRKSFVMKKSKKFGVNLINDISGLAYDDETVNFLKQTKIPFVINHIRGDPNNMQVKPSYKNVLLDIYDFFEKKISNLRLLGIKHNNIILDPGIGFGKNLKHNITLINKISLYHTLGFPLLVGTSRKRFIKDISKKYDTKERLGGTIASNLYLISQGVQILRIHDVKELNQAVKVFNQINIE